MSDLKFRAFPCSETKVWGVGSQCLKVRFWHSDSHLKSEERGDLWRVDQMIELQMKSKHTRVAEWASEWVLKSGGEGLNPPMKMLVKHIQLPEHQTPSIIKQRHQQVTLSDWWGRFDHQVKILSRHSWWSNEDHIWDSWASELIKILTEDHFEQCTDGACVLESSSLTSETNIKQWRRRKQDLKPSWWFLYSDDMWPSQLTQLSWNLHFVSPLSWSSDDHTVTLTPSWSHWRPPSSLRNSTKDGSQSSKTSGSEGANTAEMWRLKARGGMPDWNGGCGGDTSDYLMKSPAIKKTVSCSDAPSSCQPCRVWHADGYSTRSVGVSLSSSSWKLTQMKKPVAWDREWMKHADSMQKLNWRKLRREEGNRTWRISDGYISSDNVVTTPYPAALNLSLHPSTLMTGHPPNSF